MTRVSRKRVGTAVAAFYALLFAALVWPAYPPFATIEPRVLGLPFSLVYVVVGLLLSFGALFAFYMWERGLDARAESDGGGEEAP